MTKVSTYEMPNVGCLLGSAYQMQSAMLNAALADAGLGITSPEYQILRGLYSNDGQQQCDLAKLLGKDKAAVSRCVSSMERKNLVRLETVSHKCRRLWLTDKAKSIKPDILRIAQERHDALMHLAGDEDMTTFVRVLKLIVNQ